MVAHIGARLAWPITNGVLIAREVQIHFVHIGSGVHGSAAGVIVDLDGALPVFKVDGSGKVSRNVAGLNRANGFVVLACALARIQAFLFEELVATG